MTLHFKQFWETSYSDNPTEVHYGSTSLDAVVYNGTTVWTRPVEGQDDASVPVGDGGGGSSSGGYYPTRDDRLPLPSVSGAVMRVEKDDLRLWVRDMAYVADEAENRVYFDRNGGLFFSYSYQCGCTLEFDYQTTGQIGISSDFPAGTKLVLSSTALQPSDFSGVPFGFSVSRLGVPSGRTVSMGCYAHSGAAIGARHHTAVLPATVPPLHFAAGSADFLNLSVDPSGQGDYVLMTETSGWVYQGDCSVSLVRYTGKNLSQIGA